MTSMLGAVNLERVQEDAIRESYSSITGEAAPAEVAAAVRELEIFFARQTPPERLTVCDRCGGWSDDALAGCPYCGERDDPDQGEFSRENSGGPPTLVDVASVTITCEADLDREIAECRANLRDAGGSYVEACRNVHRIETLHWQQRTDADGKPAYKTWREFARKELAPKLGFRSASHVFEMARVVEEGLVADVERFGMKTAKLLASAPPDAREELRKSRENGATTRELEAKATDIRERMHEQTAAFATARGEPAPKKRGRPRGPQKSPKQRERETREACAKAVAENADPRFATLFLPKQAKVTFSLDERTGGWIADLPSKGVRNALRILVRMNVHGDEPETIEFQVIERDEEGDE